MLPGLVVRCRSCLHGMHTYASQIHTHSSWAHRNLTPTANA
jgi:hypothetical protein